jgi:DNA-binding response OmpR family regulator
MIYVLEDERNIRELIIYTLNNSGFESQGFSKPSELFGALANAVPSIILLDIMLPEQSGLSVLRKLKQEKSTSNIPVIMLTAKGQTADKVQGLEMGADDYVTKPFDMKELMARVNAVMRRTTTDGAAEKRLSFDNLTIDLESYTLSVSGGNIDTPPKELELLYHLASSPNRVFTRNQLLDEVWGFNYFGDSRTVDVHIKRLREKLERVSEKWSLKTVWGVGYKFELLDSQ